MDLVFCHVVPAVPFVAVSCCCISHVVVVMPLFHPWWLIVITIVFSLIIVVVWWLPFIVVTIVAVVVVVVIVAPPEQIRTTRHDTTKLGSILETPEISSNTMTREVKKWKQQQEKEQSTAIQLTNKCRSVCCCRSSKYVTCCCCHIFVVPFMIDCHCNHRCHLCLNHGDLSAFPL